MTKKEIKSALYLQTKVLAKRYEQYIKECKELRNYEAALRYEGLATGTRWALEDLQKLYDLI